MRSVPGALEEVRVDPVGEQAEQRVRARDVERPDVELEPRLGEHPQSRLRDPGTNAPTAHFRLATRYARRPPLLAGMPLGRVSCAAP